MIMNIFLFFSLIHNPGTDNANIILGSWSDLCKIICSSDSPDSCKLGLDQAEESIKLLSSHYLGLRTASEQTLYSIIFREYVPLIGKFIELLCIAVAANWRNAVAEETAKPTEGNYVLEDIVLMSITVIYRVPPPPQGYDIDLHNFFPVL